MASWPLFLRLHADWKMLLARTWSVRINAFGAVLAGTGTGLTVAQPYLGVSPLVLAGIIGAMTTVANLSAIYARLVKQDLVNGA
jgi:fluoride ion exporter CrcB/FEX